MFIVSKRNFRVRRADGTFYLIRKDYAGDIPEDVFKSRLVQKAIIGGLIFAPETSRDKDVGMGTRFPAMAMIITLIQFIPKAVPTGTAPRSSISGTIEIKNTQSSFFSSMIQFMFLLHPIFVIL